MHEPDPTDPTDPTVLPAEALPAGRRRLPRRRTVGLALLGATALGLVAAGAVYAATDVPLPKADAAAQVSVLQWSDGSELARIGAQNRIDVPLSQVSVEAQHAVLAAEDREFYSQPGISPKGILRAAVANVRGGGIEQGASTITQQYVKNAFLTRDRTLRRKLQEIVIATKLDRSYSKDEVLEFYLNTVYFGRGAYGIQVASQTYFGKPAKSLTAAEGAVLASLLRSPTGYDPAKHPEQAQSRFSYVVKGMASQGWLDGDPAAVAYPKAKPPVSRGKDLAGPKGYLVQQVQDELESNGISDSLLSSGGLRIRTTYDKKAQAAAVQAVHEVSGDKAPDGVRRALVAVEPLTGKVRAVYAGDDYVTRPFDDAVQGVAQAGSSFKPYVLAAALEGGQSLKQTMDGSSPQTFGDYEVKNYGNEQFGLIDLVDSTVHSVNTVYVPLGERTGLQQVAATAAALGVTADMTKDSQFPSFSLGVTAVHPIDQAVAYATLAGRGEHAAAHVVDEVRSADGRTLFRARTGTERVLRTSTADDTTFALQQVVERGTGRGARLAGRPAAGKTGTTSGNTAAWFVGYTPQLATAVTLFSDDPDVPLRDLAGVDEVTGGSLPAKTWNRFMSAALKGLPVEQFAPPQYGGAAPSPSATPSASPSASPSPSPSASPSAAPSPSPSPVEASPLPVETYTYSPPPAQPTPTPADPSPPTDTGPSPKGQAASPAAAG